MYFFYDALDLDDMTNLEICLITGTNTYRVCYIRTTHCKIEQTSNHAHVQTLINYFSLIISGKLDISGSMSTFVRRVLKSKLLTMFLAYLL